MIQLKLLGGVRLEVALQSPDTPSRRRRPLALLALVAASGPHGIGREKVMAYLWPDSDTERASNSLRQALFSLRRELHENLFLPQTGTEIVLDRSRLSVDLWDFRDALAREAYDQAVTIYAGAFLDGFQLPDAFEFSHWAEAERGRLQRDYTFALDALAQRASAEGRHTDAVAWRRRQAAADPYNSRVAISLLRSLIAAGDRPGALEFAGIYEHLVRSQLDIDPDPSVMNLVAELRTQQPYVKAAQREEIVAATSPMASDTKRKKRPRWLLAAGLAMLALASGGGVYKSMSHDTTIVVASGIDHVGGRDRRTRLVKCEGPACPAGTFPQNAFAIPRHAYYAPPMAGTSYIAPVADALSPRIDTLRGYPCCTTAVFEQSFKLPPDAVSATITVSLLADNMASVAVNGLAFGGHTEQYAVENYTGPAATFRATFAPDPSGINIFSVTLWDGRGALGLHFHGIVTYHTE